MCVGWGRGRGVEGGGREDMCIKVILNELLGKGMRGGGQKFNQQTHPSLYGHGSQ